jgi:orotidine-5'-phosphate decarboxylase
MQDLAPMTVTDARRRIFCAVDTADLAAALELAGALTGLIGGLKLGKELFTANGPQGVREVARAGLPVFLDLKFHDIPATVAGAVRAAVAMSPVMMTVHAAGGGEMLRAAASAAAAAAEERNLPRPLVIAVTVLTSLAAEDLPRIGVGGTPMDQVRRLAALSQESGLDGVVCSGQEAEVLRRQCGPDFRLVVPGIRPAWAGTDDQKRVATPAEAQRLGADYLVIGRPISGAPDPAEAARRIAAELEEAG